MDGELVTLYLKNGHVFNGSIVEFSRENGAQIKTLDGNSLIVPNIDDVMAIKYLVKNNNEIAKEHKAEENIEPIHKPGDVESLTQLRKMKHEEAVSAVRAKLLKPTPTSEGIQYGSVLSAMHAIKDDTK